MLVSAAADVMSLGAVVPFLAILTAPERIFAYAVIGNVARAVGITTPEQLVLPLTLGFAAAALISGAIRMLVLWSSNRFAYATGADLSVDVYRRTLYQSYRVHVARNSSEVISGISIKVAGIVGVLTSLLIIASSLPLLVAILLALFAIDPVVASQAMVGFGGSYVLITLVHRRRLRRNSQLIADEQTNVIKALQEGLGGIRDVLLDGPQPLYCDVFRRAEVRLRLALAGNAFISGNPRYVMEAVGMVLIAALAYGLSRGAGGLVIALPVLGALALGAQRLLPALQQGYSAWAGFVGGHASLAETIALLDQPLPAELLRPAPAPLHFHDTIRFRAVRFRYTSDGPWVLDGLDLTIPKGGLVGLVGTTGSGKSTTMDLLMGLLTPTEGELLLDGQLLKGNRVRAWQRTIAHVPQSVFLADATVAENIAFGVSRKELDLEAVRQAARLAQLADFIEARPEGYSTFVGERGIRLSGGQRQRVGIARALYKQASVLVFDEATSALDNATEESLMSAIEDLNRDLTVLLVAHRLTTVRRCDTIVEIGRGRVVAQGTYEQLLESSPSFRRMARTVA